jgi:hypothetical protein
VIAENNYGHTFLYCRARNRIESAALAETETREGYLPATAMAFNVTGLTRTWPTNPSALSNKVTVCLPAFT